MNDFTTGAPGDRLPNLIRTTGGYRVYDPALVAGTHYAIDDHGDLVYTRLPAGAATGTVVIGSVIVALVVGDDSWLWTGVAFLAALPTGFALAMALLALVHVTTNPARAYRRRTGRGAFAVEVDDRGSTDGQLCLRAERFATSPSWTSGRVDPERRLETLLWRAVGEGDPGAVDELTAMTEPASESSGRGTSIGTGSSGRGTSMGTESSGRGTSTDPDLQIV
jgi:hypothetical protein